MVCPKYSMGKYAKNCHKGKQIVFQIGKVLNTQFPALYERIEQLCDPRKRREYSLCELVFGGIAISLFKFGSRNQFDNYRKEGAFIKNYRRTFGINLPGSDAIEDLFRILPPSELEELRTVIMKELLRRKVFHKFRFMGKRFLIAIDGSGTSSYTRDYSGRCLSKTSKNGKTAYFHYVLEAKLVTHNDMAFSICTEWVENPEGGDYDKQDCEHKAFKRLAAKLKKEFPRLPLVILADGLYPNLTFFNICKDNGWDFILTFKDGNLPSIHQELEMLPPSATNIRKRILPNNGKHKHQQCSWVNGLDYNNMELSVVTCHESNNPFKEQNNTVQRNSDETATTNKFVHITNLEVNKENCFAISDSGRLRWAIENSFDYLKNHGYNLGHKFSRASFPAYKNYYSCMMIAHMINQFVEKGTEFAELLKSGMKLTVKFLWQRLVAFFTDSDVNQQEFNQYTKRRAQIRWA